MKARLTVLKASRLAALLVATVGFAYPASAQQTCSCALPKVGIGTQVGEVRAVTGTVMASQESGFGEAAPGTALRVGNSVMVGPKSTVALSFGASCLVEASENTTVQIQPADTGICVAVGDAVSSTLASSGAGNNGAFGGSGPLFQYAPAALFGGAALSATILSTTKIFGSPDRRPVSAQ